MGRTSEFDLIERYFARSAPRPDVPLGIGDDAAVLDVSGDLAVAVDTLVAGTHFPDGFPPEDLGYRVLAVNLSDLAAMGARPRWATLSLTLQHAEPDWLEAFSAGFFELAETYEVALVGGDMCRGPLAATLQLMGSFEGGRRLQRDGARVGDDIYVTGTLGDAAAGLAGFASDPGGSVHAAGLRARFARPSPRVAAGLALAPLATAAIDISDGLVADLGHICEQSRCAARLEVADLPLSEALRALRSEEEAIALALAGGDDYELCFTANPSGAQGVAAACASSGTPVARIGTIEGGAGIHAVRHGAPFVVEPGGYRHF